MKSLRFLRLALAVGSVAVILPLSPGRAAELPACCRKDLPCPAALSERSLYQLDSLWADDGNTTRPLNSLRGRPQIVTMFFASCEFACPLLVKDMKHIEAALPEATRTNVGFVLISFDSKRDTPAALARYRKLHNLGANWTLLTGTPDNVQEIAALLGVKFKMDARGQFAHSNLISLLDAGGEMATQQIGLNQSGETIIARAKQLAEAGPARPASATSIPNP